MHKGLSLPLGMICIHDLNFVSLFCPTGRGQVKWDYIHGLVEFAIYGGRVDNPFDNRVMVSYLKQLFDSSIISENSRGKKLGPLKMPGTTNHRVGNFFFWVQRPSISPLPFKNIQNPEHISFSNILLFSSDSARQQFSRIQTTLLKRDFRALQWASWMNKAFDIFRILWKQ